MAGMKREDKDPGIGGPKLSKTQPDPMEKQRLILMDKYLDAMILWCREYTPETKAKWKEIGDEYRRQFDR